MTIGVALFGYGLAGAYFHAPLIAADPRLQMTRIVSSRVDEVRRTFANAQVSGDPQVALDDPDVSLVVIATPNDSHAPLARDALRAGKHVVIDKPFVVDPADGAELIRLAQERRLMLSVFLNRRWDGDFLTVRRLLAEGRVGEVSLAELRWDRFRPAIKQGWREQPGEGTGLLADLGPHLIDQALQLFGTPESVAGDVLCQRADAQVDDYFEIVLRYGGRRVILSASSLIAQARPRFALHGSLGSFVKHGIDPQEAKLRAGGSVADADYGVEAPGAFGRLTTDGASEPVPTECGDWRRFYAGVADAILTGAPPPVEASDALTGLSVLESARRSAEEGRVIEFTLG